MPRETIEPSVNEGSSGDLALVGEDTQNGAIVSLQVLQNIYHELTGKSEDVSKSYNESFQFSMDDFEQLNHRVTQCCEQYNIKASNCSVKVFYVNDTQETFSSFERFKGFNAGSSSAVESVLFNYNFLIILPKIQKVQSYSLSVRVASRIAVNSQMRGKVSFHIPRLIRAMGDRTAVVTVKYVDYVVARNILNTVDQWFDTIAKQKNSKVFMFIVDRSHYLPEIARYIVGLVVFVLLYLSVNNFITAESTLREVVKFVLCAFVGLFSTYKVAHHLGEAAEESLDNWSQLSYISLTAGDRQLIRDAGSENKKSIVSAILKFISALMVSVLAKIVVSFID